jgi:N-acetylmuramoyl-L-alanine amidase
MSEPLNRETIAGKTGLTRLETCVHWFVGQVYGVIHSAGSNERGAVVRQWAAVLGLGVLVGLMAARSPASSPVDMIAPGVSEVRKVRPEPSPPPRDGEAEPRLLGLALERLGGAGLRVRLDFDRPARAEAAAREAPDLIVVGLGRTRTDQPPLPPLPTGTVVADYRLARTAGEDLLFILDLAAPGAIVAFEADATRRSLILDVSARADGHDPRVFVVEPSTPQAIAPSARAMEPALTRRPSQGFRVVIDPGHGGIDPGAVAPGGLVEKDIVLAVALAFQRELATRADVDVRMTRMADTFVRLSDRVRLAAEAKADLFVSIHADQFAGGAGTAAVRGGSVYVLGNDVTSRTTAALVARENAVDAMAGLPEDDTAKPVNDILSDLAARETQDLSLRAQTLFVRDLRPAMTLAREPLRAAGFRVLRQADVPAILVELGYLSHVADMAELASPVWQRRVAAAMARAVDAYRERLRRDRDHGRSPLP